MSDQICTLTELPVDSGTEFRENVTNDTWPSLTGVVDCGSCQNLLEGLNLPPVKLSVKLSFANGEQISSTAEATGMLKQPAEVSAPQYLFGSATAPEQPVLVSSTSFIQIS